MIKSTQTNLGRTAVALFFLGLLTIGILIYQDYGVSFDEPAQRLIGVTNLNHIAQLFNISSILNNEFLAQFPKNLSQITDRDYGVIFEVPAALMEHVFNLKQEREIYLARHFLTFLFFIGGVYAVYRMAERRFNDWRIGLLAATFLILSPRIFADAFYNSKDLVFLSVFAIAMNTTVAFVIRPSWKTAIFHALACAIAIDVRIMAIIIPLITIAILFIKSLKDELSTKQILTYGICFSVACFIFTTICWPYLWEAPLQNIRQAFVSMARFRHNPYLIFMGEPVRASSLPWFYLPVWIGITTPLVYLGLFFIGALSTLKILIKNGYKLWSNNDALQDLIFLAFISGPVIAVITLHSILYNGWRHVFFIYPALILIATGGVVRLWGMASKKLLRFILIVTIAMSLTHTAIWMIANHPLQNLYFNKFSGEWNNKFEVDYWGVANKQALEKILKDDPTNTVLAWPGLGYQWPGGWQLPFVHNLKILPEGEAKRISIPETKNESQYIITSMRGNEGFNTSHYKSNFRYKLIDEVLVDGEPVLSIFKKIDNPELPKLSSGESIRFSKNQMGANYLLSGWQDSEDWGSWSAGNESKIVLPFSNERPRFMQLSIRALVNSSHPSQRIEVWGNGKFLKQVEITHAFNNKLNIEIPSDSSELKLTLKLPGAARPIDLGINQDVRKIAIGVEAAEFK
ncbi:glycosyltransferase family 39 protein [Polynucleobacter sp. AP-Kaivos-20-H2]|uniref:glycosyltransferase family 39 protein n=1 Tax=Polynucleobacter sp. AP-Kaivos-20-H2 TaxID=2689104 RepID=UPI001C0C8428|nr:glycosyltransferase family 39 protein [Polynucleobacter sp. AP-Kaivos-20-H2]MBU3604089.1 glycosyltransferase family 39 protein [Polynucleobacter sp. AP-Kaivos-20-H2]